MLTRIFIDNFRSLVNFDLKLGRLNLFLGENGSGKTTVFEVLRRLRQLIVGNVKVNSVFPGTELTRWLEMPMQRFELELTLDDEVYLYELTLEHDSDLRKVRIQEEKLSLNGRPLFEFKEGNAQLYHDDFSRGPEYPFDWTQSGVGVLQPRHDNRKLTRFRKELGKFIISSIHPMAMSSQSSGEESILSPNMDNFVSWFRYLSQEHQGALFELVQEMRRAMPGFHSFSIREAGEEVRVMKVLFSRSSGKPIAYDFNELSDGQRVLIALYSILFGLKDEGPYLFLDEPENFVALREIQPWLATLSDLLGESIPQAVLISHHPEVINYLASSSGLWFERNANTHTQVSDRPKGVEGITLAENMARGWTE